MSRPSIARGSVSRGPSPSFTTRVPAFTPATLTGTWDTIVLATKAHHTETAVRMLLPYLSAPGCVVSAQNGLNELAIASVVGPRRTVGAFLNFGADYLEPGVIHYGGRGAVVVGEIDGRVTPRATVIRDAWRDFDDRAVVTPNIWGFLWGKEAYGAMLFATALTNESIADALAMPRYRELYIALAREILAVADGARRDTGGVRRIRSGRVRTDRAARRGRGARSMHSLRSTVARPSLTAASGATSPCASAAPKSMPSWASWCSSPGTQASRPRSPRASSS